jgi:hypothetical protein
MSVRVATKERIENCWSLVIGHWVIALRDVSSSSDEGAYRELLVICHWSLVIGSVINNSLENLQKRGVKISTFAICTSAHPHISTSAHQHICTSAHLHINTSTHQLLDPPLQLLRVRIVQLNPKFNFFPVIIKSKLLPRYYPERIIETLHKAVFRSN